EAAQTGRRNRSFGPASAATALRNVLLQSPEAATVSRNRRGRIAPCIVGQQPRKRSALGRNSGFSGSLGEGRPRLAARAARSYSTSRPDPSHQSEPQQGAAEGAFPNRLKPPSGSL